MNITTRWTYGLFLGTAAAICLAPGSDGAVRAPGIQHPGVLASSRDGRLLAVMDEGETGPDDTDYGDDRLAILDAKTGQVTRAIKLPNYGHINIGYSIACSPDGRSVALATNHALLVWDVAVGGEGRQPKEPRTPNGESVPPYALAFSPDGKMLAGGYSDDQESITGQVFLWDATTLRLKRRWDHTGDKPQPGGAVRPPQPGEVVGGGRRSPFDDRRRGVQAVAFSPNGKNLATCGDGSVKIWDLQDPKYPLVRSSEEGEPLGLAFSPDGRWLALAGRGPVETTERDTVWRYATDKWQRESLVNGDIDEKFHTSVGTSIAFSPDGSLLAALVGGASRDERYPAHLVVLDGRSGRRLWVQKVRGQGECRLAFSSDGNTIITGGNGLLQFWDAPTRKLVRELGASSARRE